MQFPCCYFTFCKTMTLKTLPVLLMSVLYIASLPYHQLTLMLLVASPVCMSGMSLLLIVGNRKYGIGVGSDGLIFMPSFVNIGHLVQRLKPVETQTHTAYNFIGYNFIGFRNSKQSKNIFLLFDFLRREIYCGSVFVSQEILFVQKSVYSPTFYF